jgi:hypothetical protein
MDFEPIFLAQVTASAAFLVMWFLDLQRMLLQLYPLRSISKVNTPLEL